MTGVLMKRGKLYTDIYVGIVPCEDEAEVYKPRNAKDHQQTITS